MGLIGSSVARIARERGDLASRSRGQRPHPENAGSCGGTRHSPTGWNWIPARAVVGADCVMLCAPVGAFADLAVRIAPHLAPGAVLTDVGSTKQSVIRDVGPLVPEGVHFVPAHPIAGTEYSGPDSGLHRTVPGTLDVTDASRPARTRPRSRRSSELWRRCGSLIERMEPSHHDRVLAIVSHLPHLIAFTICGTADDLADESRQEV